MPWKWLMQVRRRIWNGYFSQTGSRSQSFLLYVAMKINWGKEKAIEKRSFILPPCRYGINLRFIWGVTSIYPKGTFSSFCSVGYWMHWIWDGIRRLLCCLLVGIFCPYVGLQCSMDERVPWRKEYHHQNISQSFKSIFLNRCYEEKKSVLLFRWPFSLFQRLVVSRAAANLPVASPASSTYITRNPSGSQSGYSYRSKNTQRYWNRLI